MRKLMFLFSVVLVLLLAFSGTVSAAASPENVKVLIGFNQTPGQPEEALVRGFGGNVKYNYHTIPVIAASIPVTALPGLSRNPRVNVIEPDVEIHAVEDSYPWGVSRIGAAAVQQSGFTGDGVKIAILDTGMDYSHPDFVGAHYMGGYDFVNGDSDPMDDNGHGTHVAGIIAAQLNGSGIVGVAPGADIYILKVLDSNGSGYFSDVIAALLWATGDPETPGSVKVDITNNSYGSSQDPGIFVQAAFLLADLEGVLNVAAAGNSGNSAGRRDNVIYPAKYDSAVAVAATDVNNLRAYFSSTGPAVELAAPGLSIYSTIPGGGYASWSGTSMASPHVAGAAALVMSSPEAVARDANNDHVYETNGDSIWTNQEVRALLQATALDLGAAGKDNLYGYGLVDVAAAVAAPAPSNIPPVANAGPDQTVFAGETVSFDGSGSSDPDGTITDYSWDFGDGSTGSGITTTHTYQTADTYTVTLTVTDNDGETVTDTATVNVEEPATSAGTLHVAGIEMGIKKAGVNTAATATVSIVDENGQPVAGAIVHGQWSEATLDSDTGVTDSAGQVTLQSDNVKRATDKTFTFSVESVELAGYSFVPSANDSNSISVP